MSEFVIYRKNIKKNLRIYLLWILCYLPLALYEYFTNITPWYKDLFYYIRGVAVVGETPYAWPLWYMLALIVSVSMIYIFRTHGLKLFHIWRIGIGLMLVGYIFEQTYISTNPVIHFITHGVAFVFGTISRNGIFEGLAIVSTGMLMRKYYGRIKHPFSFGILFLCIGYILMTANLPFELFFSGTGWFLVTVSVPLKDSTLFKSLRIDSVFVYFTHMFIVFAVSKTLQQFLLYQSIYLSWLLIFIAAICLALCLNFLRHRKLFTWINLLIE